MLGGSFNCEPVNVNGEDYMYYAKYKCVPAATQKIGEGVTDGVSLRFGQLAFGQERRVFTLNQQLSLYIYSLYSLCIYVDYTKNAQVRLDQLWSGEQPGSNQT